MKMIHPDGDMFTRSTLHLRPAPRPHAFTLVELLVVVTIIVILLAMMAPALDRAMEEAVKVQCAANLHAFGTASSQYAMEHKRKVLTIPRHYKGAGQSGGEGLAYPWFIWLYAETFPDEISMEAIRPYIGETQPDTPQTASMGKLWICPASQMEDVRRLNETAYVKQPRGPVTLARDEGPGIWGEYAWFAGGGGPRVPAKYFTSRHRLNSGTVGGGGIVMGDNLFRYQQGTRWYYNHGEYAPNPGMPWGIEGMNAVYGDGSGAWIRWDEQRKEAALGIPGSTPQELGDYVSAIGAAADTPSNDDLFTFY